MIKRQSGAESKGKLPHLFILSKTATFVPAFAVEHLTLDDCNLGSCVRSEKPTLRQNADDDDDDDDRT